VSDSPERACALVGPGRAGTAVALALLETGRRVVAVAGRTPDAASTRAAAARLSARAVPVDEIGQNAGLVVIATPDAALEATAAAVTADLRPGALVIHLSGARGLDALEPITQARSDVAVGALHPLQTLASADDAGRAALRGAWAAVAGPDDVGVLAVELGLRPFRVDDSSRALYHAAACVASNHLVALLGQVDRLADAAGVPSEAFAPLVRTTVDNAFSRGPAAALTGPVARGDVATVAAHLDAMDPSEHATYRAVAAEAHRLSARDHAELHELLETGP
jgi:predicted short-subunit dehydrogenase-like oxidoreductase (DUF2520 family)